jgi:hypothetical protein
MSDNILIFAVSAAVFTFLVFLAVLHVSFDVEGSPQIRADERRLNQLHVACLQGGGTWTGAACTRGQP